MSGPRVSDHALLRFLERGGMADVESLRASLSASLARAHAAARQIGGGRYLVLAEGLTFVVRDGIVTTVLEQTNVAGRAHALTQDYRRP